MKHALIFGAGNIGRGFLAELLYLSGYRITFVDLHQDTIDAINYQQEYVITQVDNNTTTTLHIDQVRALHVRDSERLAIAVEDADLIMSAVGKDNLRFVAQTLRPLLVRRAQRGKEDQLRIVVTACENMIASSSTLKSLLFDTLTPVEQRLLEKIVVFPDVVVDRIVPTKTASGLDVTVEKYYQFCIDATMLPDSFDLKGVDKTYNINAKVDQKLFTLNMAHAFTAYYGYKKGYTYIHEAIDHADIRYLVASAIDEVSCLLEKIYGDAVNNQSQFGKTCLQRFANSSLQDSIERVARDPMRKMSGNDRIMKPISAYYEQFGQLPVYLDSGASVALSFKSSADEQSLKLHRLLEQEPIEKILTTITGLNSMHPSMHDIASRYRVQNL